MKIKEYYASKNKKIKLYIKNFKTILAFKIFYKLPGQVKTAKGKFDYGSDNDGIISLPNKNPYWHHYRRKTWFTKEENRFINQYDRNEKI